MKKITVIVPMYFEEAVVSECYKRLKEVLTDLKDRAVLPVRPSAHFLKVPSSAFLSYNAHLLIYSL